MCTSLRMCVIVCVCCQTKVCINFYLFLEKKNVDIENVCQIFEQIDKCL